MSETSKSAIIKTGGQQFIVRSGDTIKVNKIVGEKGAAVILDQVLTVSENGQTEIGTPVVENRSVNAKIIAQVKDAKVVSFKKKRRKGFNWKRGHRQQRTEILIEAIN